MMKVCLFRKEDDKYLELKASLDVTESLMRKMMLNYVLLQLQVRMLELRVAELESNIKRKDEYDSKESGNEG